MKRTIVFKCIGVLVDGHKMRQSYRDNMAQLMSERYGKSSDFWHTTDAKIVSDWASYHADLNFSGTDGIADIHEGLFRVTRALFNIAQIPEPSKSEITALAHELIALPCSDCLLGDTLSTIEKCQQKGFSVGIFSYLLETQLRAISSQIKQLNYIIGADTLNHYEHDLNYFRKLSAHLKTSPDTIIIVAPSPQTIAAATQAGMQTILVNASASLESDLTQFLEK